MRIRAHRLKKYFGTTRAVDDVSFEFSPGQVVAFVGPNGAGKTTTMRILASLDEPTDGDIFFDDISAVQYPEKACRLVGYMPDSLPAHRDMTVHDYLDFFARAFSITGNTRRKAIESIQEFTNLTGIRDKYINALSKGMKQRVSLARALIHDPPVLVLDEPAAGLDPRARIELRELLRALAAQGKAILVSSHILTELSEICDSTIIIEKGRIIRAGSLDEIAPEDLPTTRILLRTLDEPNQTAKALLQIPLVADVNVLNREIQVDVEGKQEACAQVLAALIKAGYSVTEFRQVRAGLEDIFMNLTKGELQ